MNIYPFYAVVSDLDGTLLQPNHRLGTLTKETLKKIAALHIDIIVATGRPYLDVKAIFDQIPEIKPTLITSNGAVIHDYTGKMIFSHYLPTEIANKLTNLNSIDKHNVCVNIYTEKGWFIDREVPELKAFHQDSNFHYQVTDFSTQQYSAVEKVFFLSHHPDKLAKIAKEIKNLFNDNVEMTYSNPYCLEVMNKGISKATTLKQLLVNRPYDLKHCIAFGDGLNDEDMLKVVGSGCVMGNADPRLRIACNQLPQIGNNGEEAVANYLKHIFGV